MDINIPLILSGYLVGDRWSPLSSNPDPEDAVVMVCVLIVFGLISFVVTIRDLVIRNREK